MMPILAFLQNFSEIREMTLNDLRGQKKNYLERPFGIISYFKRIIKNWKHSRMMPILAFLRNFSEIREMTLNDLRGQTYFFDVGFREVNKHLINPESDVL